MRLHHRDLCIICDPGGPDGQHVRRERGNKLAELRCVTVTRATQQARQVPLVFLLTFTRSRRPPTAVIDNTTERPPAFRLPPDVGAWRRGARSVHKRAHQSYPAMGGLWRCFRDQIVDHLRPCVPGVLCRRRRTGLARRNCNCGLTSHRAVALNHRHRRPWEPPPNTPQWIRAVVGGLCRDGGCRNLQPGNRVAEAVRFCRGCP